MDDWLRIQCEKQRDPDSPWNEFIQANPVLNWTMTNLLAERLQNNQSSVQNWIEGYQQSIACRHTKSEYLFTCRMYRLYS